MAYSESYTENGSWLLYRLEPSDLAVYKSNAAEAGITLLWKGSTDVNHLGAFFERAARRLYKPQDRLMRAWIVTQSGPQRIDVARDHVGPISREILSQAEFVRFECLRSEAEAESAESGPLLAVCANLDQVASSLDDLQQSVSVYLQPEALPMLSEDIARVVVATSSPFFPEGQSYQHESVLGRLREVGGDMRTATLAL